LDFGVPSLAGGVEEHVAGQGHRRVQAAKVAQPRKAGLGEHRRPAQRQAIVGRGVNLAACAELARHANAAVGQTNLGLPRGREVGLASEVLLIDHGHALVDLQQTGHRALGEAARPRER
jgi:hypothetical protein